MDRIKQQIAAALNKRRPYIEDSDDEDVNPEVADQVLRELLRSEEASKESEKAFQENKEAFAQLFKPRLNTINHQSADQPVDQPGTFQSHAVNRPPADQPGTSQSHAVNRPPADQPGTSQSHVVNRPPVDQPGTSQSHAINRPPADQSLTDQDLILRAFKIKIDNPEGLIEKIGELGMHDLLNGILEISRENYGDMEGRDVIAFLGDTKSGKSSVINLLLGNALSFQTQGRTKKFEVTNTGENFPRIGNSGISETMFPKIYGESYMDCPGFGDTRNSQIELMNMWFLYKAFKSVSSFKLVLCIQSNYFTAPEKFVDFKDFLTSITEFFGEFDRPTILCTKSL